MRRAPSKSVVSRVLRNQIDLLHAIGNERPGFLDDVALRAAAMRAAHLRNDAKAARMIAALGDLQIRKMLRRQAKARRRKIRNENRAGGHVEQGGMMRDA